MIVIGERCRDIFVYGDCRRICPEAPVPVFNPLSTVSNEGMAGNVVSNLTALGIKSIFICNKEDIIKTRYVDEKTNQMLLRVDENDRASAISDKQLHQIYDYSQKHESVIISDYDKGFLSEIDIREITSMFKYSFLDTKKMLGVWMANCTFIKLNSTEFEANRDIIEFLDLSDYVDDTVDDKLIVTMGQEGCRYKGKVYPVTEKIQTMDVSGAGDTFHSAFVVEYLKNKNVEEAIAFAQACTNEVIKKKGVATI